ncbi:hypothetical protein [Paenibacillus polymyxa]|uniref:hypothetical protein n=1 Tax=Paenibacillus polymyxa TaxID=1406 RepID=UPI0001E6CD60|nr:hypothetical protein [Paenibacillus polymyxa]WPQ59610.1 hypothetical protein SKN87_28530 [Paenibacillus polymyxa]
MNRKTSLLMFVVMSVVMMMSFTSIAFAQTTQGQTQNFSTQGVSAPTTPSDNGKLDQINVTTDPKVHDGMPIVRLPNVQIDQAEKWVERKGYDVVGVLQTFVQPFAIAIFIVGAILTAVGSLGNSNLIGKGIIAMVIAIVMYAIVLSAPELMDFMNAWLKS